MGQQNNAHGFLCLIVPNINIAICDASPDVSL
jgi:hypothetical protein